MFAVAYGFGFPVDVLDVFESIETVDEATLLTNVQAFLHNITVELQHGYEEPFGVGPELLAQYFHS